MQDEVALAQGRRARHVRPGEFNGANLILRGGGSLPSEPSKRLRTHVFSSSIASTVLVALAEVGTQMQARIRSPQEANFRPAPGALMPQINATLRFV